MTPRETPNEPRYEPPALVVLGSLHELTQTTVIPKSLNADDGSVLQSGESVGSF